MTAPFSRIVRVETIPKDGQTVTLDASPEEREALAAAYGLPAIASLGATLDLVRGSRGGVRVTGRVHGELTQVCVVSLEPFPASVDEDVDVRFAPRAEDDASRRPRGELEAVSMTGEDEPDPIVDGRIDLGALAAEFFSLGLDPYPKKPGATFEPPEVPNDGETPFAVLRGPAKASDD
jgi:Large ribosomal RNA subunit accumulation protein YceD